jgi:catechol 2,3-dioxygenase-like lactoylglutathione lyase family enzyme
VRRSPERARVIPDDTKEGAMGTTEAGGTDASATVKHIDTRLEVVVVPVSDVDRARQFYGGLGWRLDADIAAGDDGRVSGPDPEHRSYGSYASFSDPDGNGWLLQEVTTRLPGRVEAAATSFASAGDLASALRRAAVAHGEHEQRTGGQRDENWPDWYAAYMVAEQAGTELPT